MEYVRRYFGTVDGPQPTGLANGGTVADLLAGCDRAVPVNVAYRFLPRPYGMPSSGCQPPADDGALATIADMVRQGMNEGAVGLSSGREYMPGAHADAAEWAELTRVVAACDGVYVTHMRGYANAAGQGCPRYGPSAPPAMSRCPFRITTGQAVYWSIWPTRHAPTA
ncbi:hypothetical protein GCM10010412_100600 [Nonomuraea recticatena]|uniref:Amidohydrolase family protein n=1 Tax=Nonomuraea recticatena TaxID=46178 RepID=A0ABN3THG0_9ACTN